MYFMDKLFEQIKPEKLTDNIFKLIGKDWMLITAGSPADYNMMTASWGCAGFLWSKPVMMTFVRPQRLTYEYLEKRPGFTCSFFEDEHREMLNLCGTTSGRDLNKMDIDGLTPLETPSGHISFKEAKLIIECRKIYFDDVKPELFLAFELEKIYPTKDYHRMYIGEIRQIWERKK